MTLIQETNHTPATSFNGSFEIHHIIPWEMFKDGDTGDLLRNTLGDAGEAQSANNRIFMFKDRASIPIYQQLVKDYPQLKNIPVAGTWHSKKYSQTNMT